MAVQTAVGQAVPKSMHARERLAEAQFRVGSVLIGHRAACLAFPSRWVPCCLLSTATLTLLIVHPPPPPTPIPVLLSLSVGLGCSSVLLCRCSLWLHTQSCSKVALLPVGWRVSAHSRALSAYVILFTHNTSSRATVVLYFIYSPPPHPRSLHSHPQRPRGCYIILFKALLLCLNDCSSTVVVFSHYFLGL